jgi:hypothetical protein
MVAIMLWRRFRLRCKASSRKLASLLPPRPSNCLLLFEPRCYCVPLDIEQPCAIERVGKIAVTNGRQSASREKFRGERIRHHLIDKMVAEIA